MKFSGVKSFSDAILSQQQVLRISLQIFSRGFITNPDEFGRDRSKQVIKKLKNTQP